LRSVLLLLVLSVAAAVADPPWAASVKAADVGDTINEGESCLACDGDYVYAVCNVAERSRVAVIPYGRSTDGGATWTTTWWKDPTAPNQWHSDPVIITDDTGYVHLFVQFSTALLRHYLSTDHGLTWCDTADVSTGASVDKPWVCYYGNELYCCWQQVSSPYGIVFARSANGGRSWNSSIIDDRTYITGIDVSPSGILYIVLRTSSALHVFKSTDRGATWPSGMKKTLDNSCTYSSGWGDRAPMPSIAAPTDNNVFVTLVDQRYGNWDILSSRSTDGGATWTALSRLNDSTAGGQCKGWVEDDRRGGLHVLWYHTPSWPTSISSRWSVRYQYSSDYGVTWRPSIRLNDTTFTSPVDFMGEYHIMRADSQRVRCVWTDGREGDLDLFFAEAELNQIGVVENPFRTRRLPGVWLSVPSFSGPELAVRFGIRRGGPVKLSAFDASGRKLTELDLGSFEPGPHQTRLSGLPRGQTVFLKLDAGETATGRTTILP